MFHVLTNVSHETKNVSRDVSRPHICIPKALFSDLDVSRPHTSGQNIRFSFLIVSGRSESSHVYIFIYSITKIRCRGTQIRTGTTSSQRMRATVTPYPVDFATGQATSALAIYNSVWMFHVLTKVSGETKNVLKGVSRPHNAPYISLCL